MASEGELEAARRRLAAAKDQASSASKVKECANEMLEMALKNIEVAQSQLTISAKEVEEAEKCLKDVERRNLEVIDVDLDDDNKKRKKRSMSPEPEQGRKSNCEVSEDNRTNNDGNSHLSGQSVTASVNEAGAKDMSIEQQTASETASTYIELNSDQILVEGCGDSNVNGVYIRKNNLGDYSKNGNWRGHSVTFEIQKECWVSDPTLTHWSIYVDGGESFGMTRLWLPLYQSGRCADTSRPPKDDWKVLDRGESPPPLLRFPSEE